MDSFSCLSCDKQYLKFTGMGNDNKFKPGDSVNYRNGMDFKNFSGIVEKILNYKGHWHYFVKDSKDHSIKRVVERCLSPGLSLLESLKNKNKFKTGDMVKYKEDDKSGVSVGIVERSIHNYRGIWEYMVKDVKANALKRIEEKFLELNPQQTTKQVFEKCFSTR